MRLGERVVGRCASSGRMLNCSIACVFACASVRLEAGVCLGENAAACVGVTVGVTVGVGVGVGVGGRMCR